MKISQFSYTISDGWKNLTEANTLDSDQTLVLAFAAPEFREHPQVFKELKKFFPKSRIVGCSTSGEIMGTEIFDLSLSLVAIKFEQSSFKINEGQIFESSESEFLGRHLAGNLNSHKLKGILLFSDGLITNGSALAAGINSVVNDKTVVSGGLAGDGSNFSNTWLLLDDEIKSNAVIAIGLYGEKLDLLSASRGGWDKFGPDRYISKSKGNVLYEIDDRPALDLYKEYLGEKANELPASGLFFPLQIRSSGSDQNRLVRTLLSVNEAEKSITFAGDMPEGYIAQLMKANFERVIDAAGDAGLAIKNLNSSGKDFDGKKKNFLTIAISCVGRRLVLRERAEEELEALKMTLPPDSPICGFYSYGELGANIAGGACDLHNQSMTVLTLSESDSGLIDSRKAN